MENLSKSLNPNKLQGINPIVRLWILRLLVPLGGYREFINKLCFSDDSIAENIGLGHWVDSEINEYDAKSALTELRKIHKAAERNHAQALAPDFLRSNISRIAKLVGLSEVDSRILEFAVMIHDDRLLDTAADMLGVLSSAKVFQALSIVLDIPEYEIRLSLSAHSTLAKSGLVSVARFGATLLRAKLELLSDHFADYILSTEADPISLFKDVVKLSSLPHLEIKDYAHVTSLLMILRPYLKQSIATRRKGVNIFMHGDPGTGKSQLAKVLARELECELFEVASEDDDGDPVNGSSRLRAFRAAQSFFTNRRAIILFDEVEDVFNDHDNNLGQRSTAQSSKAWMNRMLEENEVPTIWLSNSVHGVDPAFIRRFDMVFELPVPPKKQREQILLENCSDLLDSARVSRISASESLAPAVIIRSASVIRSIKDELRSVGTANAFELLIENTLVAQGHKPLEKKGPSQLPDVYDPYFIHADSDLTIIAAGLTQSKSGRLCLYGPPGTGKTAYGKWLANEIGVPLMVKRASDLMSKWVGENEQNIARVFREAERDGALLLIDEVDTFLQDRRGAERSWEVSLVNEMLTQMESFSGVFIASTNLMDNLDQAALRRFDLKVKFGYLKPQQAGALFRRYCAKLSIGRPKPTELARVMRMQNLTPGDFSAVARQILFRPIASIEALISALESECQLKEAQKSSVGFLH